MLIRYIILFFFVIISDCLSAQIRPARDMPFDEEESMVPDSVKRPERNIAARVVAWNLKNHGAFIDSMALDTLNRFFHNYHPAYKNSITNTYTGNLGSAYLNNDFSGRSFGTEFYFANSFDAYILTPDRLDFYNTTTPYTMLDYSQSENKNRQNETRFNVLHSQNINRNINVTFRYDQTKSDGQYNYQESRFHSISLYSSYSSDKLNIYGGAIFNRIRNQENGGIVDDNQLLEETEQEYLIMNLADARTEMKGNYFFASGEYRMGTTSEVEGKEIFKPIASLIYYAKSSSYLRLFREGEDGPNSEFFPVFNMNPDFTYDSVRMNVITNQAQILFHESAQKKFSFGKRAFAGVDIVYRMFAAPGYNEAVFPFHPGNYSSNLYTGPDRRWNKQTYNNFYVGGGIFRHLGDFWTWDVEGRQYLSGYRLGQTEINGNLQKPLFFMGDSAALIKIHGNLMNRKPDYFQQEYFSNRASWKNNFVNEQLMNAGISFHSPGRKLEAGARYSLINNYIYHNMAGVPAQANDGLLIFSAYLDKEFNLGAFSLKSQILWQKASAPQYVHLPDFSLRLVPSFDFVLAKVLYTQLGVDMRMNTEYYADAYQPSTGFFHLQNEKKLGSYPYMDAFANLKLKRTRIFFQYMNLGSGFLSKPYFTALHYPMNQMTFRLGVAWSFYN